MTDEEIKLKAKEVIIKHFSAVVSKEEATLRFEIIDAVVQSGTSIGGMLEIVSQCEELGIDHNIVLKEIGSIDV
jgi:hypothetical protein